MGKAVINRIVRGILVILFIGSFTTSSARFSEFDTGSIILFQIKVFARNIKETTLARYFIKVNARHSFTRLKVIRGKIEFMKYENRKSITKIQFYLVLIQTSCVGLYLW